MASRAGKDTEDEFIDNKSTCSRERSLFSGVSLGNWFQLCITTTAVTAHPVVTMKTSAFLFIMLPSY